jgi:hypothetical protein
MKTASYEYRNTLARRGAQLVHIVMPTVIESEDRLRTKLYDKRDDFNFPIVNFSVICSNIPAAPAYGIANNKITKLRFI